VARDAVAWGKGFAELQLRAGASRLSISRQAEHAAAAGRMGADITVVPAQATFDEVMRHKPDASVVQWPGDPEATGVYAIRRSRP